MGAAANDPVAATGEFDDVDLAYFVRARALLPVRSRECATGACHALGQNSPEGERVAAPIRRTRPVRESQDQTVKSRRSSSSEWYSSQTSQRRPKSPAA